MGELNKSSDFSELDVIGELVEFDDVMKRCQGIAGLTRAVGSAGGQGVIPGYQGVQVQLPGLDCRECVERWKTGSMLISH